MTDILFIKTSSLGDVIHHMPALTEAKAHRPEAHFAWVVEEAFAPLVRLHPALSLAIPIATREWRRALHRPATWRNIANFLRELRAESFDEIVDTQGLLFKSALIARYARGRSHGYDAQSIKEPLASWLYDVCHRVAWNQHAVARNRALTAQALGYTPSGPPDYGLNRAALAGSPGAPYGVLLHASAQATKEWPVESWRTLAAVLGNDIELIVPYGTEAERGRAERIATATGRARVPERQPIDAIARLIAGASFVIGGDTGLLHLAAALSVPLIAIFTASEPGLTGPVGSGPITVLGRKGALPSADEVLAAVARLRASGGARAGCSD